MVSTVIRNDTKRYDLACYTYANTLLPWNLEIKSPKRNRGAFIVTLLNSLKY